MNNITITELARKMKNFHPPSNLRKLYLNESTADVHFVFENERTAEVKRISAHKCLLAIASPVFHRMFFGELKEEADVRIVDVSADGFSEFLQFFYMEEVNLTGENFAEVMTLADKYDVPGCMHLCEQFLEITLTLDSICWCYELATLFHLQHLIDMCEERICMETKSIFDSEGFLHCPRQILARLLSLESLSCDEIDVLHASMRWATEACKRAHIDATLATNKRQQLAECFDLIRFPAMSAEDFSKCLSDYDGLFTAMEMLDILSHLTLHRELRVATQFPLRPRHGTPAWTKDDSICICDRRTLPNLCRSAKVTRDAVIFSVNERVLLGQIAISIFKMDSIEKEASTEYRSGILSVYRLPTSNGDEEQRRLLLTQTVQLSSSSHTKVQFVKPIIVQPFEDYEIETQWELEDGDELVLRTDCRPEVMLDGGVRFQFKRRDQLEYDNVTEGLVSRLYFKKW